MGEGQGAADGGVEGFIALPSFTVRADTALSAAACVKTCEVITFSACVWLWMSIVIYITLEASVQVPRKVDRLPGRLSNGTLVEEAMAVGMDLGPVNRCALTQHRLRGLRTSGTATILQRCGCVESFIT